VLQRLELERRSSLHEVVDRGGVWFDWPDGVAEPAPPVFWGENLEAKLLAPHRERGPYPGVGIACIRGALVLDEAILADGSGQAYLSDDLFPSYANVWIERGDRPKQHRPLSKLEAVDLPGVSVLVHNWNAGVYGHWLVEGLPKLLYLRTIPMKLPRFVVETSAHRQITNWIRYVAPDAEIASYDPATQYVRCEALVVPTMACSSKYVFHPALFPLLEELAPRRRAERLLYLDRPWRGFFHWMENDGEVQALAQSLGFEVFSPIKHSVEAQIDAFASARVIAGDYGSALHNSLFSPPQTRVLCFNWVTFMQSRIAQLCRQRIGFQMGDTGAPLTHEGYTVDLDAAKRAFDAVLSA
jgi:O-antigen biosynthesis protein WbqL